MKRIFVAAALILSSVLISLVTKINIDNNIKLCIHSIEDVRKSVEKNNPDDAKKNLKKVSDVFHNRSKQLMNLYYEHSSLSNVQSNLILMNVYLNNGQYKEFKSAEALTVRMLKNIKEKEELTIQNVM